MGAVESTGDKVDMSPDGQVLFLAGYSGAGKTFLGDYLTTTCRGWEHVDGDLTANPEAKAMGSKEKFAALYTAMQKVLKGGTRYCEEREVGALLRPLDRPYQKS